jgi:hypothetical protein
MIRKSGTGFPSRQTRSVCPEIMRSHKLKRDGFRPNAIALQDAAKDKGPARGPLLFDSLQVPRRNQIERGDYASRRGDFKIGGIS